EYCNRNYHQILPIIAEKVHHEKVQQEKLRVVKACLNFEETSRHSESGTPIKRRGLKERLVPRHVRSRSRSPDPRRDRPESPKKNGRKEKKCSKGWKKVCSTGSETRGEMLYPVSTTQGIGTHNRQKHESCPPPPPHKTFSFRGATESASERRYTKRASSRRTEELSESEGSAGVGHNTDECMHLKKQIKEMLKAGKLSHLIKELKQNNRKEQPKVTKKGETSRKDKALAILMGKMKALEGVHKIIEAEIAEGHCVHRQIQLLVKIGDEEHYASSWMNFMVVRSSSPYNGIIGRLEVRKLQAVPSTAYGMLKILVEGGVITLKSSKLVPLECTVVSGHKESPSTTKPMIEERIKNLDIFAWKPADMTSVTRHITKHRLNVQEGCSPVRQRKRGQGADRNRAIQEEVGKLVEAGIMKEVHYHD
ncbi:hypothetical protein Tco_0286823, partial [Tanacetum coccineum]